MYDGASHTPYYRGMMQDFINFFSANRDSSKPVYVRPSDPKITKTIKIDNWQAINLSYWFSVFNNVSAVIIVDISEC